MRIQWSFGVYAYLIRVTSCTRAIGRVACCRCWQSIIRDDCWETSQVLQQSTNNKKTGKNRKSRARQSDGFCSKQECPIRTRGDRGCWNRWCLYADIWDVGTCIAMWDVGTCIAQAFVAVTTGSISRSCRAVVAHTNQWINQDVRAHTRAYWCLCTKIHACTNLAHTWQNTYWPGKGVQPHAAHSTTRPWRFALRRPCSCPYTAPCMMPPLLRSADL